MQRLPPDPPVIARVQAIPVFENSFGVLYNDETRGPKGDPGYYLRWQWRHDGVVIVPYIGDRVAVWKMFRYPIDSVSLEFPRGGLDADERLQDAAVRELKEETGLSGLRSTVLGRLYPDSGLIASATSVLAVEIDAAAHTAGEIEPMESIATGALWMSPSGFSERIVAGEISCAITIAAWSQFQAQRPWDGNL